MIAVGDPAPDFELPSETGETVRLSKLRGRRVVIYFYPKDDTSGCTAQAREFRDLLPLIDETGALMFGISPDPVDSHARFRDKYELNFPLLADVDRKVAEAFGVWKEKKMYGRTHMGIERSTFVISPDGIVEQAWRKVRAKGNAATVLGAVEGAATA